MRIASTFMTLTLVCLTCICCGCLPTASETASNEGDASSDVGDSSDSPIIPDSMVPEIAGVVDLSAGEEPPVPNHPRIQPAASTPPAFDPNLPVAGSGGERVRAVAGVGKQGQSLNDEQGVAAMIVQPAKTLFAFKQSAVFEIQIPSAVKLFAATEGRKPNSHEEFMNKIIKFNKIKLPTLPAGEKYVYDPQEGELMVQKPRR